MRQILYFVVLLGSMSSANAMLMLSITGTSGSDDTTWTFSGSTVAGQDGFFEDGNDLGGSDVWWDIGNYTGFNDFENIAISGSAMVTIGGVTRAVDLVYIDNDTRNNENDEGRRRRPGRRPAVPLEGDDFGIGVEGTDDFNFLMGDTVAWTGALLVSGIGLDDLSESGLPFNVSTSNYGGGGNVLALQLNIGDSVTVPAPAAFWLFCSGLLLLRRNRR